MKNLIKYCLLFTSVILLSGFLKVKEITEEQKTYQKVLEVEGTQLDLYNKSLEWATAKFSGKHQLSIPTLYDEGVIYETGIQISDKDQFKIVSNAYSSILAFPVIQIKYQVKIESKDNRVRVTFSDYQNWWEVDATIREWNDKITPKKYKKIVKEFDIILEQFEKALIKKSKVKDDSDW